MTAYKVKGHLAAFSTNLIFGLNMPITAILLSGWITPMGYTMSRVLFATALFWIISLFHRPEKVTGKDLAIIALGGFLGFIVSQFLYAESLMNTTVVCYSLIAAMGPVIVMLLATLFLKEPISILKCIGVALGVGGALLLILNSGITGGHNNLIGILLAIASNTAYAGYIIITRSVTQRYSPVTIMKWLFLFTSLILLPFGIGDLFCQRVYSSDTTWRAVGMMAFVLVGATAISYFLIPFALQRLRATTVSIYMNLQPIVASMVAIWLGQDTLTWDKPIALVLVIAGAIIVTHSPARRKINQEST